MRTPDFQGMHGRAWRITGTATKPDHSATIGGYLTHCPTSHPIWPWHLITMVHLRPIEGAPPAKIHRPGLTHEILVLAIDPENTLTPDPDAKTFKFLSPPDVVHQVMLPDDEAAAELLELVARACCDGHLVPDEDFRSHWQDVLDQTADHFINGHAVGEA